jgi:hypothetical protein
VAGPLTRHHQLVPQLGRIAETDIDPRWRAGILLPRSASRRRF